MGPKKRDFRYDLSKVNQQKECDEKKSSKKKDPLQMTQEHFEPPISPSSNPFPWIGRLRNRRNQQQKQGIEKNSLKKDCINTSDYGSASEGSRKSSLVVSADEGCWEQMRNVSIFPESPLINDDSAHFMGCSSLAGWSDSDNKEQEETQCNSCTTESRIFKTLKEEDVLIKVHSKDGVVVLIPTRRTSCDNYELTILTGAKYEPHLLLGTIRASKVILLEPGAKFCRFPALIFMPLLIEPGSTDTLECLYSNTSSETNPKWEKLPSEQFYYRRDCGIVVISTLHFSLFTVVIRPQPKETRCVIKQRGGRLRNSAAPGVEVKFPRGCLDEDIVASVQVLFEDDPFETRALASPIVMVGPHGYQFSVHQPPVTIRLPIPDYTQIRDRFPTKLTVWQSNTSENEAVFWERLEVKVRVKQDSISRGYYAVFPVYHFSFFKIMWDILSASLLEAKMGMSYFYPFISFSMMCQAFMEENADSSRFGLEVICHRSDRRLPELTNYKHRVGASLKPKLLKPGKILVRLKSQLFEADIEAGEDPEMLKEEYDFRGRDFEKQYACRFKLGVTIDRGTFGKVTVERVGRGLEPVFEFNLQKSGNENESTIANCSDRWSIVAIKELAGTLRILEDQNWKTLARYIGFTRQEIKTKLQYSADPFLSIVSMYQARSGSPEEFLQALYAVSRDLQISANIHATERSPRCVNGACGSQGSSQKGSSPQGSQDSSQDSSQNSSLHATKKGLWASLSPWKNKDEDSDTSGTQCTQKSVPRKRTNPSSATSSSKGKSLSRVEHSNGIRSSKRPKHNNTYPDDFDPVSSSTSDKSEDEENEEIVLDKGSERSQRRIVRANRKKTSPILVDSNSEDECSTQKCKRDPRMMTDGDLWRASSSMNNINWRALGRTLGLQESALVNIESSYRTAGCRECAYQVLLEWKGQKPKQCTVGYLYTALTKESMNEVAKKIAAYEFGLDE